MSHNTSQIICSFYGLGSSPKKKHDKKSLHFPQTASWDALNCQEPITFHLELQPFRNRGTYSPGKLVYPLKDDGFFQTGPFLIWPGLFSCIFGWYIKITFHDRWNRPTFGISKTATTCRKSSEMTGWRYAWIGSHVVFLLLEECKIYWGVD